MAQYLLELLSSQDRLAQRWREPHLSLLCPHTFSQHLWCHLHGCSFLTSTLGYWSTFKLPAIWQRQHGFQERRVVLRAKLIQFEICLGEAKFPHLENCIRSFTYSAIFLGRYEIAYMSWGKSVNNCVCTFSLLTFLFFLGHSRYSSCWGGREIEMFYKRNAK